MESPILTGEETEAESLSHLLHQWQSLRAGQFPPAPSGLFFFGDRDLHLCPKVSWPSDAGGGVRRPRAPPLTSPSV